MKKFSLPLTAAIVCMAAQAVSASAAFAQAAYIRPLSPPPEKPAHGFYIGSIKLVPEDLDTDNGLYTATVEVRMEDLPGFSPNNQAMTFTIQHLKASGTIQDLRNQAKREAQAHFDDVIGTFQKYKDEFAKGRR